jgi:hypothetical protein
VPFRSCFSLVGAASAAGERSFSPAPLLVIDTHLQLFPHPRFQWAAPDNIKIELKVENMMFTLNEFERIAGDFENSRSVTRGFNETSTFVEQQIDSGTDFEVKKQQRWQIQTIYLI